MFYIFVDYWFENELLHRARFLASELDDKFRARHNSTITIWFE